MAGLGSDGSGTFTPTGSTEVDIFTPDSVNNLKYYMFKIFTDAMVNGDKIEVRIYDWDIVSASFKVAELLTIQDAQPIGVRGYQPPLPQYRMKVTLKEITNSGTHKAFNWERLSN